MRFWFKKKYDPFPDILINQTRLIETIYAEKSALPHKDAEIQRLQTIVSLQESTIADLRDRNYRLETLDIELTKARQVQSNLLADNAINGFFCELMAIVEAAYPKIASNSMQQMEIQIVDALPGSYRTSLSKDKLFIVANQALLLYQSTLQLFRGK